MSKIRYQILFIALFTGIFAGVCSSAFLYALEAATRIRSEHLNLIWGLPVFGLIFGQILKKVPSHLNKGVPYILSELHNPKANVSPWMAPFVFITSLGTHLFGGSAGREGVGVIMGASISHLLPKFNISYEKLRPYLIYSGIAAGFSSIFGTPFAALIFAFELHHFKDFKKISILISTLISSFTAFYVSHFLGPKHMTLPVSLSFEKENIYYVLIAALTSGTGGLIFYYASKNYSEIISKLIPKFEWRLALGGLLVSVIVYFTHAYSYIGIGTDIISQSFISPRVPYDFIMKCLLTVLTLSVGFKGGEVTPLFFMGSTFSNSLASHFRFNNYGLSSALGMVGLFGAVTATPLASMIMGLELFGWKTGVLCIGTCLISRWIMGRKTIYKI